MANSGGAQGRKGCTGKAYSPDTQSLRETTSC